MRSKQRGPYAAYLIKTRFPDKPVYVVNGGYTKIKEDLPEMCTEE